MQEYTVERIKEKLPCYSGKRETEAIEYLLARIYDLETALLRLRGYVAPLGGNTMKCVEHMINEGLEET